MRLSGIRTFVNNDRSRTFVSIPVDETPAMMTAMEEGCEGGGGSGGWQKVCGIIEAVNGVFAAQGLQTFHKVLEL